MSRKTQWDALKKLGFSDKAAAVIMGHAMAESGCECDRVQGDFSADRARSRAYTAQVDAGQISEHDFVFRGPGGGGYGWLQWTFPSRKKGLYDTARRLGVSVGREKAYIEGYRYVPDGEVWTRSDGVAFRGLMVAPAKAYERIMVDVAVAYLDDDEAESVTMLFEDWQTDTAYAVGDRRKYEGLLYRCV